MKLPGRTRDGGGSGSSCRGDCSIDCCGEMRREGPADGGLAQLGEREARRVGGGIVGDDEERDQAFSRTPVDAWWPARASWCADEEPPAIGRAEPALDLPEQGFPGVAGGIDRGLGGDQLAIRQGSAGAGCKAANEPFVGLPSALATGGLGGEIGATRRGADRGLKAGLGGLGVAPGVASERDGRDEREGGLPPVGQLDLASGAVQGQGCGERELIGHGAEHALCSIEAAGVDIQ